MTIKTTIEITMDTKDIDSLDHACSVLDDICEASGYMCDNCPIQSTCRTPHCSNWNLRDSPRKTLVVLQQHTVR